LAVISWTIKWAEDTQKNFQFFNTVQSSNITAKSLKTIPHTPLLFIAYEQTNPYGRKKRRWSPSDFMATWTWKNSDTLSPVFSPLLGLALYHAFQQVWPSDLWSLKAPNDIYLADKKTAGLLLETQAQMVPRLSGDDIRREGNNRRKDDDRYKSDNRLTDSDKRKIKNTLKDHDKCDGSNRWKDHIRNIQVIFGLGINVLKAPSHAECIKNHHDVTEITWRKFLDHFWKLLTALIHRNASEISREESQTLKQALQKHPQHKDLIQVEANGSLTFKNKTIHWSNL